MQPPAQDDSTGAQRFISPLAIRKNTETAGWARAVMAAAGATACGVCGVTGFLGFVAYAVFHVLASGILLIRMNFQTPKYYAKTGAVGFLVSGFMDNLLLFVLFWSLSFALTHFY